MLNKKLVIAALLAAAQAQADTTTPAADTTTPAADTTTPAADTTTPAADTTTPAADSTTPAADSTDPATPAADDAAKKDDDSDGLDFEKARKAWKETLTAADGTETERILCDVGEDAFWEEAQAKFKDLEAKLAKSKEAVAAAQLALDPLEAAYVEADGAKVSHKSLNAAHLAAQQAAVDEVARLGGLAGGTDATGDMTNALNLKIADTTAAQDAVETQGGRIQKLIDAKRTQDQEEALWTERVTAATNAEGTASTAKNDADAALLAAQEQVTTRSWLFEVLKEINSTTWSAACNTGANPRCQLAETAQTTTTSTWAWPANCNYTVGSGLSAVNHTCTILGLSGSTGLVQSAAAVKGTIAGASAATELYLAYQNADYTYVSSATQLASVNSSPLLIGLDAFEKWQKMHLRATILGVACWKDESSSGTFVGGDEYTWCHTNNGQSGAQKFHPLLQGIGNTDSLVYAASQATTLKGTFGDGTSNDSGITVSQQVARAKAQVNLWFADWVSTALDEDWVLTGKEANRTAEAGATWEGRTVGNAETVVASKVALLGAATKEKDAVTRWKAAATEEAQAAAQDLVKAQTLLGDLIAEIAPIARAEIAARNDLKDAVDAQAVRVAASAELGAVESTDSSSGTPVVTAATGAQAVLEAATVTKESVDAQQEFHDARAQWAMDNRAPALATLNDETMKMNKLKDMRDAALEKFDDAREACKSAAFQAAQEAREEAVRVAEAKKAKAAEVLKAYTDKSKFPDSGAIGTLCHYAKTAADAAQTPRTECAEGEPGKPLCCGAAQRFLKDGTKLSIETCQLASDTTYTYYPALPAGALVAPTAETWRFQCISAAQKLAAAATAALAAGYMMA